MNKYLLLIALLFAIPVQADSIMRQHCLVELSMAASVQRLRVRTGENKQQMIARAREFTTPNYMTRMLRAIEVVYTIYPISYSPEKVAAAVGIACEKAAI